MADKMNQDSPNTTNIKGRAGKAIQAKGKLLATIFVVGLVMVYAVLGMSYLKQLKEHGVGTSQFNEVTQTLNEIPPPPQDLEQRLAEAEASLAAEQSTFPSTINTTQLINTVLALANSCGVKATPMVTKPWSTETVGQHTYPVLRLTVAVEGSFSQLVTFASQLEKGDYDTLVMENLDISRSTAESEEGTTPITGSLKLAVYGRSLSSE
jgi:Tfp pilus assembly protein PilO